ncbi:MAG TPA: HEAT repeat domain-containing protein, partial [Emticicia sp.]
MYQEIEKLLEKYYEGETTLQEEKHIKEFFSKAEVPTQLQHHIAEFAYYRLAAKETPSKNLSEEVLR